MTREARDAPQFYLTAPSACPYLPGQQERKIFTHLVGKRAAALNDLLTQTGFRRSQTIAYRPACESCRACVSVRVLVDDFRASGSQRRTARANADLLGAFVAPKPTNEHYVLFRSYLDARHPEGGMADMSSLDFAMMVEDTHIDTVLTEYRPRCGTNDEQGAGPLLAVCLTDRLADGLSLVYSFYAPDAARRSLGSFFFMAGCANNSPKLWTFNLVVKTNTPADFYTVNSQLAGYYSSTMWSQQESFYVQVVAAAPPAPVLEAPRRSGNYFSVQVATTSGFTYYLEYTTNLSAPAWNAASQTPGNGTIKTLTDTTATDSRRFYQAHAQ